MESHNKTCLSLPPVVTKDYPPKGSYITLASLQTYTTGSASSTIGIIDIYDVFGFGHQTIQGADRLSAHAGALVLIPDFFDGKPLDPWVVPRDTPEKKAAATKFLTEVADYQTNLATFVDRVMPAAKAQYPSVQAWAVFGLCWGGKLAVLGCAKDTALFKVSGQAHPAQLNADDARAMLEARIPHICLASPHEPAEVVKEYAEVLGDNGEVEPYDMFHGWMGGRANFEDEKNAREFERGYQQVGSFVAKYL